MAGSHGEIGDANLEAVTLSTQPEHCSPMFMKTALFTFA